MQLTLVSHYGPKPAPFAALLRELQSILVARLGPSFSPYALGQIHGTIIGLEGTPVGGGMRNDNFHRLRGEDRHMDFAGLLDFHHAVTGPLCHVQVGGFRAERDYAFTSQGLHPHLRSFSLRGQVAVAMGWPVEGGVTFPSSLDQWRRRLQQFGLLHKWHRGEADVDNDFFFVLGRVGEGMSQKHGADVEQQLREHLVRRPLTLPITRDSLAIVAYSDPQLPPATSQAWPVDHPALTAELLARTCLS